MARNKYSNELKEKIINDYINGISQQLLCEKYTMGKSVISRIINFFKQNNSVQTVHRGGRPRITSERDDKMIIREIKKYPFISSREIKHNLDMDASCRTIRRRAVDGGLSSFKVVKKPYISMKNKKARIKFATDHINWSVQKWKSVLFSDESKFNLKGSDGNRRVRRPLNQALNPLYTKGTVKHGGGNTMVWGCFSGHGMGPISKIDGIMDRFLYKDILETHMLPYAEEDMPLKWIFQHDNDPKHTSKLVKSYLEQHFINVMVWPAQSPDLNPIENLWEIVDRRIIRENCRNKDELFNQVKEAWESIPKQIINNLIESMPRRCAAVLKAKGYSTKY